MICGWDRDESHASARKHAARRELTRRRPGPEGFGWDAFTGRELGAALGVSFSDAEDLLGLADALETRLPGTKALFRSGILSQAKAAIIACATALLDPEEARAAEALVLGRAGSLTPAGLRAAIRRAVMEVAPDKARKRREHAAKKARVERWAEGSGNAGLAGRNCPRLRCWPPISGSRRGRRSWARPGWRAAWICCGPGPTWTCCWAPTPGLLFSRAASLPVPAGPLAGVIPPGFACRVTMTIPAPTLLDLADRPGELAGIGPDLPRPGPRPGRCRGPQPPVDVVPDRDRQPRARDRAQLRPSRHPPATTPPGPNPVTSGGPDPPGRPRSASPRPATLVRRRVRHLAVRHRDPLPAGPAHLDRASPHRGVATTGTRPGAMIPGMLRHLAQVRHATCTGPAAAVLHPPDFSTTPRMSAPDVPCTTRSAASPPLKQPPLTVEQLATRRPLDHPSDGRHTNYPLPHLACRFRAGAFV